MYFISFRLTKDDVAETGIIGLKFVKFQNVHSLTVRKQGFINNPVGLLRYVGVHMHAQRF